VCVTVLSDHVLANTKRDRARRCVSDRRRATVGESSVVTTSPWNDPATASSYIKNARASVPYLPAVHGIVEQILAETVPDDGRLLVVGAGGGLELTHLAERHGGWRFDGVDPSAPMLQLAKETMGPLAERATLSEGHVENAPVGPFDGATCLLTLHFLQTTERLQTLKEIRNRLRPGAPLLTFHHSVPDGEAALTWFKRFARTAAGRTADDEQIDKTANALATNLPFLSPEADEALLREAGFKDIGLFFAALTFRGWVAYA
jgi:tRNA (cmo5U34)-methyltransferase